MNSFQYSIPDTQSLIPNPQSLIKPTATQTQIAQEINGVTGAT
ncbi:hypothetical protein [Nostoc sp. CALU 1950]